MFLHVGAESGDRAACVAPRGQDWTSVDRVPTFVVRARDVRYRPSSCSEGVGTDSGPGWSGAGASDPTCASPGTSSGTGVVVTGGGGLKVLVGDVSAGVTGALAPSSRASSQPVSARASSAAAGMIRRIRVVLSVGDHSTVSVPDAIRRARTPGPPGQRRAMESRAACASPRRLSGSGALFTASEAACWPSSLTT